MFSISFKKHCDEEKEKLLFFDHQDVNSLCLHHHYINISYQFCVSIKLQKHNSWPISTHILLGLFSKCCYWTWYHRGFINNYSRKAIVFPAGKTFLQLKFLIRRTSPQVVKQAGQTLLALGQFADSPAIHCMWNHGISSLNSGFIFSVLE